MKFGNYLKKAHEIDCNLIIADVDMPAAFCWDCETDGFTKEGRKFFRSLLDADVHLIYDKVGNLYTLRIDCDDENLGEFFTWAKAGYISETRYNQLFIN